MARWSFLDKEQRAAAWLYLLLPIGFFWALVLLAPLSSGHAIAERLAIGAAFTVFFGLWMWLRAVRY